MKSKETVLRYIEKLKNLKDEMVEEGFGDDMTTLLPLIDGIEHIITQAKFDFNDDLNKYRRYVDIVRSDFAESDCLDEYVSNIEEDLKIEYEPVYEKVKDKIESLKAATKMFLKASEEFIDALEKSYDVFRMEA